MGAYILNNFSYGSFNSTLNLVGLGNIIPY